MEFPSADEAKEAFDSSSGLELKGRSLHIDFAMERTDSPRGLLILKIFN